MAKTKKTSRKRSALRDPRTGKEIQWEQFNSLKIFVSRKGTKKQKTSINEYCGYKLQELSELTYSAALMIQKLAIKLAPVDTGGLEQSIMLERSQTRGERGQFGKVIQGVYVDENYVNSKGVRVGNYARAIHEQMGYGRVRGALKLGPKSVEKAQRLGVDVGGKFLQRAFQQIASEQRYDPVSFMSSKTHSSGLGDILKKHRKGIFGANTYESIVE